MNVRWAVRVEDARLGRGEDRVATRAFPDRLLAVVTDGAGGVGGGRAAAETICSALDEYRGARIDWLLDLDRKIAASSSCGLAAAVIFELRDDGIREPIEVEPLGVRGQQSTVALSQVRLLRP